LPICDGYDGVDWQIGEDNLFDLLGEDNFELLNESVTSYNLTGDLMAAAREADMEDAEDNYNGECNIWVSYCYSDGTLGRPTDGFETDEDGNIMVFNGASEAQEYIDELESGIYYLSHGEMGCPIYRIVIT
jgi:hypothetical protein